MGIDVLHIARWFLLHIPLKYWNTVWLAFPTCSYIGFGSLCFCHSGQLWSLNFFTPWISIYCRCHILFLRDGMRVFGPNISDLRLGTSEVPVRRSPSHWCWEVAFDKPMFPGWKEAVSSPLLLVYINWAAQLNLEANHLCTHTVHFPWLS